MPLNDSWLTAADDKLTQALFCLAVSGAPLRERLTTAATRFVMQIGLNDLPPALTSQLMLLRGALMASRAHPAESIEWIVRSTINRMDDIEVQEAAAAIVELHLAVAAARDGGPVEAGA